MMKDDRTNLFLVIALCGALLFAFGFAGDAGTTPQADEVALDKVILAENIDLS